MNLRYIFSSIGGVVPLLSPLLENTSEMPGSGIIREYLNKKLAYTTLRCHLHWGCRKCQMLLLRCAIARDEVDIEWGEKLEKQQGLAGTFLRPDDLRGSFQAASLSHLQNRARRNDILLSWIAIDKPQFRCSAFLDLVLTSAKPLAVIVVPQEVPIEAYGSPARPDVSPLQAHFFPNQA